MSVPDGCLISCGDGRVLRVFAPRWWQLWRWAWWILPIGREVKDFVAVYDGRTTATVRCVLHAVRLP